MNKQQGFTLVELMIVVAIIAILAVIAVPNLIQYTVRAKISEAMTIASAAKTSVSEYYTSQGVMPSGAALAGIDTMTETDVVSKLEYAKSSPTKATIKVSLKELGSDTKDKVVTFTGVGSPQGVTWICTGTDTTVPDNLLPANCRG